MIFRRALGGFNATMVVVGGIIGAGIFINSYIVAQRLDSAGWVLAAWLAGGAIALAASPWLALAFGSALVPVMFSYGGWQNANYVAEEIREPIRNLPRSLVAGTALVVLVYGLVNLVYLRTLGHAGLAATQTLAADAARQLFGATGNRLIALAISILRACGTRPVACHQPSRVGTQALPPGVLS